MLHEIGPIFKTDAGERWILQSNENTLQFCNCCWREVHPSWRKSPENPSSEGHWQQLEEKHLLGPKIFLGSPQGPERWHRDNFHGDARLCPLVQWSQPSPPWHAHTECSPMVTATAQRNTEVKLSGWRTWTVLGTWLHGKQTLSPVTVAVSFLGSWRATNSSSLGGLQRAPGGSPPSNAAPPPPCHHWRGRQKVTFVLQVLVLLRPPHSLILVSNTTETTQLEKATVKDHQGVSVGKMPKIWKWMPFPVVWQFHSTRLERLRPKACGWEGRGGKPRKGQNWSLKERCPGQASHGSQRHFCRGTSDTLLPSEVPGQMHQPNSKTRF